MSPNIDLLPRIRRILCYAEWVIVAIVALNVLVVGDPILPIGIFLIAFVLLSFIFPVRYSLWQRTGYIALGLSFVLFGYITGIDFNVFLYLYIAKSCFLLNRKSVIAIVIVLSIISTPIYIWAFPKMYPELAMQMTNNFSEIWKLTFDYLGSYFIGNTLLSLFSFMVIAEQKSRQRAEALAQQVESLGVALERTRIAREIHDSLGHTLTNLQIQLAVAQEFRQHNIEQAFRAIDMAKLLTDQCIEDVSRSLSTMRQPSFNLNQALNSLVEQIRQSQSLRIQWEFNLPHLPLAISHHLYCIIKEGLINIQKHARASVICVRGLPTTGGIILEIGDNGRGFDPQLPRTGLGLKGIEERVQSLKGQFKIHSYPNQGTQIQIFIPYPSQVQ